MHAYLVRLEPYIPPEQKATPISVRSKYQLGAFLAVQPSVCTGAIKFEGNVLCMSESHMLGNRCLARYLGQGHKY
jgi:hypothetical protein